MADDILSLPLVGGEAKQRCRRCWVAKSLDEFERRGASRRRGRICKACRNADRDPVDNRRRVKAWQKDNPEKRRAQSRRSYENSRTDLIRWIGNTLKYLRSACKKRKTPIDCTLTPDMIGLLFERQEGKCALTGRDLIFGSKGQQRDSMSMDRIQHGGGYVIDNIRLVTYQANMARGPFSDDELFAFCEAVLATRAAS